MNRRSNRRVRVNLLFNRFLNGHPYMCRMIDISPSGLRIQPLLEPARAPRFMGLQFQLPGTDTVFTASGEMMNGGREGGYGVRFTSLPGECASAIQKLLG